MLIFLSPKGGGETPRLSQLFKITHLNNKKQKNKQWFVLKIITNLKPD